MTPLPDYILRPILENPADDLLRLAAADWWEENGESERSEFVRLQIQSTQTENEADAFVLDSQACEILNKQSWGAKPDGIETIYWRRGFVLSVRLTMREFAGGECSLCCGKGRIPERESWGLNLICGDCHGTGRTPGLAKWIGENWPVTRIEFSDKSPLQNCQWWDSEYLPNEDVSCIPTVLFESMWDSNPKYRRSTINQRWVEWSYAAVISALSTAAVKHTRRLAGLDHAEIRAANSSGK